MTMTLELAKVDRYQQTLLAEIDKGLQGSAELLIPDTTSAKDLLKIIRGLTGIISISDNRAEASVPLLGRALWMARNSAEFLAECGYDRIKDFYDKEIRPALKRSRAYDVAMIWDCVPMATIAEVVEIGVPTMVSVARAVGKDASPDYVAKVMDIARNSESNADFKKKIAETGNVVEGSLDTARITLSGPVPDINDLRSHLSDQRFQRWALDGEIGRGDFADAYRMILAAIESTVSEWPEEEEQPPIAVAQAEEPWTPTVPMDGGPGGW